MISTLQGKPENPYQQLTSGLLSLWLLFNDGCSTILDDVKLIREVLDHARELRCCRRSLLLASIDVETQYRAIEFGRLSSVKLDSAKIEEMAKNHMEIVSKLYEELLQEADLVCYFYYHFELIFPSVDARLVIVAVASLCHFFNSSRCSD